VTQRAGKLPREVFLSHSSRDQRFTLRLAEVLRGHGVPVWYSGTEILGAQQWHDQIGAALRRCDWFVVILSPSSVKSEWVRRELLFALNDRRYKERITPLLHRPCNPETLSWTLSGFQRVDFTTDFDDGCRDLLRAWGKGFHGT
jgi:hypothetical protein